MASNTQDRERSALDTVTRCGCEVKRRDSVQFLLALSRSNRLCHFSAECVRNGGFATVVSATVDSAFGSWRDCAVVICM
jgi:hypothetical protein